jgi:RNA polymerase sigma-70 factor (ECF subfamily)
MRVEMHDLATPRLVSPSLAIPERRVADRPAGGRTDRRIARGLRRGDPRALEALHAEYGRTVHGYLRGAVGDAGTAEDVFQRVMTEVWRRGEQYDPARGTVLSWVMTIARSRAIDELRRRRPEPDADAVARLAAQPAPGEDADALADRWRVAHLLGRLPHEEADLLRLRFFDDLSQTEIADRTGIALGTVKKRMVRGLARLRDLMDDDGWTAPATTAVPVAPATRETA